MSLSLLEIVPSSLLRLDIGDFFPKIETFAEACAWHGPELHVSGDGFALFRKGGPSADLRENQMDSNASTRSDIVKLLSGVKRFSLSIDDALALTTTVEIPRTTGARTDKILALRRQQSVPAEPTHYFHGWYDDESAEASSMRRVIDVVIRRDFVERVLAVSQAAGAKCELIFVRSELAPALPIAWEETGQPYKSTETATWHKRMYFGFMCLGLGALGLIMAMLYQHGIAAQNLNDQIAVLQPKAAALAKHQKVQEALQMQMKQLALAAAPAQLSSQHIEGLANSLDDDVMLTSLAFDRDIATLEGLSPAPEQLIDVLSKMNEFKDVAFAAPVFRNPGESKSRFSVRLTVSGHKP
jgi:Tfp pilus assembly protein PilN